MTFDVDLNVRFAVFFSFNSTVKGEIVIKEPVIFITFVQK